MLTEISQTFQVADCQPGRKSQSQHAPCKELDVLVWMVERKGGQLVPQAMQSLHLTPTLQ